MNVVKRIEVKIGFSVIIYFFFLPINKILLFVIYDLEALVSNKSKP